MHVPLSKPRALDIATDLWKSWWHGAPVTYPNFIIELHYLDFFIHLLKDLSMDPDGDVVPVVRSMLDTALEKACRQIEQPNGKSHTDGATIKKAMGERRLILRKQWVEYNSGTQGKKRHALPKELWEDYNHWLLALTMWNGFVDSFDPAFTVHLPEDAYDPDDVLLREANKPLWCMWMAFEELGRTFISNANNHQSISISPFVSWQRYKVS
jgi:hypothetical protein